MGRKSTTERVMNFSITATPSEKARIDEAAHAAGLPRATFIRRVIGEFIAFQNRQVSGQQEAA